MPLTNLKGSGRRITLLTTFLREPGGGKAVAFIERAGWMCGASQDVPDGDFPWLTLLEGTVQPETLRGAAGSMRESSPNLLYLLTTCIYCVVGFIIFPFRGLSY